jgi:hypothetical protein
MKMVVPFGPLGTAFAVPTELSPTMSVLMARLVDTKRRYFFIALPEDIGGALHHS